MKGRLIDGLAVAAEIISHTKQKVDCLKSQGIRPCLATLLVGEDPGSIAYIKNKQKAANDVGIITIDRRLPAEISQNELIDIINLLNQNDEIHGILVQLPLPSHINEFVIINVINPYKDVDGLTPYNMGMLLNGRAILKPCTPSGIMQLLDFYKIDINGMDAVIVNRSKLVGKPMTFLLLERNTTVTICHSKTKKLDNKLRSADIIVTAVGNRDRFILTEDMVSEDAIVIDVGITRYKGKIVGDTDFQHVKQKTSWITPVPGGVGPMTIAMLLKNTLTASSSNKVVNY